MLADSFEVVGTALNYAEVDVKNLMAAGVGIAGASAVFALFAAATATAAPDVVGQKYSDASSAISDSGSSAKVASVVGDALSQDDCIVTRAWDAPFVRDGAHASGEVMVALNCNGDHATANHPGASVGSPEGRAAKAASDQAEEEARQKAEQEQQQALEEVSTPDE